MNEEIINTPDGDRPWKEVRVALGMYDRHKERMREEREKRSVASKKGWEKRRAHGS